MTVEQEEDEYNQDPRQQSNSRKRSQSPSESTNLNHLRIQRQHATSPRRLTSFLSIDVDYCLPLPPSLLLPPTSRLCHDRLLRTHFLLPSSSSPLDLNRWTTSPTLIDSEEIPPPTRAVRRTRLMRDQLSTLVCPSLLSLPPFPFPPFPLLLSLPSPASISRLLFPYPLLLP
ncbi:hypothetical protein IE53DRAFT_103014 [Violaceomyces palustris]|uniref:Uncharacterized protein n=1 Tax=Violaceomyces palustris TaxID=1673888 RepID=A0ACD0NWP1_9BASI|nr:hypothetical protein IE53DRAFT_103014 [Violaceomyces palustris]